MIEPIQTLLVTALKAHQAQNFEEAISGYEKVLKHSPNLPEALNFYAMALYSLGRTEEALKQLHKAITVKPDYADAFNNFGNILHESGDWDGAFEAYKRVIEIRAESPDAYYNLAIIFLERDYFEKAAEAAKRAVFFRPDYPEAYAAWGTALFRLQDAEGAEEAFNKALELNPNNDECFRKLGDLAMAVGKLDKAAELHRRAIEINPGQVGSYRCLAELSLGGEESAKALQQLENLAKKGGSDRGISSANFALGAIKDKIGDHEGAFENYLTANSYKRKVLDVNVDETLSRFARTPSILTPEYISGQRNQANLDGPIFIVGMPRSGTTLTEQIVSSHSQVTPKGELPYLPQIALGFDAPKSFPENVRGLEPAVFKRMAEFYLEKAEASPTPYFSDKLPANFQFIGLIHMMFPEAPIIHCLRDPLDTCISCFTKNFAHGQSFSYDLADLGRYYRAYRELMIYWEKALPGRILTLRYEETVADLEDQAKRLLDYCRLPWEDRVLEFYKSDRPVWTASAGQVQKPIYTKSVQRWRRYEKFLGPLIEALGPYAEESLSAAIPAT